MAVFGRSEFDITLYSESLKAWREWLESAKQEEWLLRWGMLANRVAVIGSLPLWMLATILSIPLTLVYFLTFGLPFLLLNTLVLNPLIALVGLTSRLWEAMPPVRPVLLIVGPFIVVLAMIFVSLLPAETDRREAERVYFELWPLSQRRMRWIAMHGTGKPEPGPPNTPTAAS